MSSDPFGVTNWKILASLTSFECTRPLHYNGYTLDWEVFHMVTMSSCHVCSLFMAFADVFASLAAFYVTHILQYNTVFLYMSSA